MNIHLKIFKIQSYNKGSLHYGLARPQELTLVSSTTTRAICR